MGAWALISALSLTALGGSAAAFGLAALAGWLTATGRRGVARYALRALAAATLAVAIAELLTWLAPQLRPGLAVHGSLWAVPLVASALGYPFGWAGGLIDWRRRATLRR